MRRAFADTLVQLATEDDRVILLTGDLGFGVFDDFQELFPDRFINVGICEQAMVDISAGLAMEGYKPIVYSIASFMTGRAYEQIRVTINYQKLPVIIVGAGGGYVYAKAGPTHHAADDLGLMNLLPGMTVTAPGSPEEVSALLPQLLALGSPSYMRIGKYGEPNYAGEDIIKVGRARCLEDALHPNIALISIGDMAFNIREAEYLLAHNQKYVEAYQMHTLKPLDEGLLGYLGHTVHTIIVVEEHSPIGGLYAAISAYYSQTEGDLIYGAPTLLRCGTPDELILGVVEREELRKNSGCDVDSIVRMVESVW